MLHEVLEVRGRVAENDRDSQQRDGHCEDDQQTGLRRPLKPRDVVDEPDHPER